MPHKFNAITATGISLTSALLLTSQNAVAEDKPWSVVPYVGMSHLSDQSPLISGAAGITPGTLDVTVDAGFTAGLSLRYDYSSSRWSSEFGWEYRSNDTSLSTSDGSALPSGNYASNTFYVTGRYALSNAGALTPWVGGGLSWIQEIDLDSENSEGERSFSDSGSVGFQLMAGLDYDISSRLYLTSELRVTSHTDIDLQAEGETGSVSGIDYQPVTLSLGIGYRF